MTGVNKHIIIGHLGGDPEVKETPSGGKVATFSIATGESWRDKATGERKEKTEWHRIVIWHESLVKIAEQYLKKGSKVYIEGPSRTRKWKHQDGSDRYVTEIVLQGFNCVLTMLDRAQGVPDPSESDHAPTSRQPPAGRNDDMNDDIPF